MRLAIRLAMRLAIRLVIRLAIRLLNVLLSVPACDTGNLLVCYECYNSKVT